ncbi:cation:proton antiporter [Corynebacterium spheniscorum]|uniref:Multisubunit sodium/proton antiporter, MrpF subunit (TC 2.A.63.1) n=1 Tax=Corynebacterium spheniscorum TaxID=185761 RepID=A0A1I2VB44_9CORY|nr:cation:proton antiporter [Corynebacterium spheniscorum]KAA8719007.1 cation:proton antiporter [Corynebacterium spheniscorum]SFG85397.1 multisubunit sodium/proton antiporter, MrpF subunit (TC 2.A.63.1) [Corynebacterium spheniscorum]
MTPFYIISTVLVLIIAISLASALLLILTAKDYITRAVVADMVFYSMVALYIIWTMNYSTSIAFDIMLLAALLAGVLPTLSMARILSKGRR